MKWVEFAKGDGYKESLDYYKHGYEFCLDGNCIFLELTHTSKNGSYKKGKRVGCSPEIGKYIDIDCFSKYEDMEYSIVGNSVIIGDLSIDKNKFFLAIRGIEREFADITIMGLSLIIKYRTRIAVITGKRMGSRR